MRATVSFAGMLLGLAGCQSSRPLYPTGIYGNAAELRRQQPGLAGIKAGPAFFARKLVVANPMPDGDIQRTKVRFDSAWGYADRGRAYRVCRQGGYRGVFRVEQRDTLTVYSQPAGKTVVYYCSAGLSGPLVVLRERRLRRAFADNPAFIASLAQLRWYESPQAFIRTSTGGHRYRIVDFYRQSLGLPPAAVPAP